MDTVEFHRIYRKHPQLESRSAGRLSLLDKLQFSIQKIDFLEVDLLRGALVDTSISSDTPDPFLEQAISRVGE